MNNGSLAPFVWRWWWVLLIATLLAAGAGYGAATRVAKTYEAETQLLVGQLNTTVDLDASGTLARTYAQIGKGRPILAQAIQTVGARLTPTELGKASTIDSNEITRIISVRVQNRDPRTAAQLADAISAQLVDLSSARRAKASSGIDAFEHEPEIQALPPGTQNGVLAAAERVFSGSVAGGLHVTESAEVPTKPVKPSIPLLVVLAAVGGLLLASGFALAWDARDPAVPIPAPATYVPAQRHDPDREPAPDAWDGLIAESRPESGAGHR
jgi:capsular polysaccharide biosynthesis protein